MAVFDEGRADLLLEKLHAIFRAESAGREGTEHRGDERGGAKAHRVSRAEIEIAEGTEESNGGPLREQNARRS